MTRISPQPHRPAEPEGLVLRGTLLDAAAIQRTLERIAAEIVERHGGTGDVALVGIRTGGLVLAERLQRLLARGVGAGAVPSQPVPLGALDISLYRDDVFNGLPRPMVGRSELAFPLPAKTLVLVDDVLYTGRTVRAALDAIMDYGRPRAVKLAVLVDRGHRELPIQPDYIGARIETTRQQVVRVDLSDGGAGRPDAVLLYERGAS